MGALFSSPDPAAASPAPTAADSASDAGASSGKSGRRRTRRGRGKKGAAKASSAEAGATADEDDADAASAPGSARGGGSGQPKGAEARLEQLRRLPLALEQAWQEADRLGGLLHGWGCVGGAGVAKARATHSHDLAVAFQNIGRLADTKGKGKQATVDLLDKPHAESGIDKGEEPNDFDRKRTKKLVRKLRDAARKNAPLKLVAVAGPWGDESAAWRARFLEERGTSLMLLLDGLEVRSIPVLKAQRKAIFRCIDALTTEARAWAASDGSRAEDAAKAAEAAAAEEAAAKKDAIEAQRVKDAEAAAAAEAAKASADGWKGAGKPHKGKAGAAASGAAAGPKASRHAAADGEDEEDDDRSPGGGSSGPAEGGGWQVAGGPAKAAPKSKGKGKGKKSR